MTKTYKPLLSSPLKVIITLLVAYYLFGTDYINQRRENTDLTSQITEATQALAQIPESPQNLEQRLEAAQVRLDAEQSNQTWND